MNQFHSSPFQGWKYLSNGDVVFWFRGTRYIASLIVRPGRRATCYTPRIVFEGPRQAFLTAEGHVVYQEISPAGRPRKRPKEH